MYSRPQLPGRIVALPESPRPMSSRSPAGVISVLLIIFALSGGAWYASKNLPKRDRPSVPVPANATMPVGAIEDLLRHADSALVHSTKAMGEIRRSEAWVGRVVPSLQQNYMAIERRRLEAAQAASDSARRDVEQAREELEILKNLLIERSNAKP